MNSEIQRRHFIKWIGMSGLYMTLPIAGCIRENEASTEVDLTSLRNVFDVEKLSKKEMGEDALLYLNDGVEDRLTLKANVEAYKKIQIRARRLIDVRNVSTGIELFGESWDSPLILSPVGYQQLFHPHGEIATAKAAAQKKHLMMVSSVANHSISTIADKTQAKLWFQLYPTTDRKITKHLLQQAENSGCKVCVLTIDHPVLGNREVGIPLLRKIMSTRKLKMGNFEGIFPDGIMPEGTSVIDPSMTWDMVGWLKENCGMKIILKGIVTKEDAALAVEYGADGIVVSNHGGRQLESNLGTIECLPEVVDEIDGRMPVMIDGGIRRGTDIFKALALGATAVCIGRPFCWGLGALGQQGVELVLDILMTELKRDMQLAGVTSIQQITKDYVRS
ncbi:alpha-hydroxy acid oxidase [Fulvivirgaceae bacterium BMA10]|uniref:Alpha-hydroxy acid oxidase n=1 Tax=Splendidivirga corallicola TaxID=3051826 RepID=A0ABT8L1J3_9BACT|nr:alpha-hydroxy acid oxidase [Fulvivirgaceae bacterium BMA10]